MAIVTVKNRYPAQPFVGRYDGEEYVVADTLAVPEYVAEHLKRQSIVKFNPVTGDNEYRLAILERGEDTSTFRELPQETLDRSDMDQRKVEIRKSGVRHGVPERRVTLNDVGTQAER